MNTIFIGIAGGTGSGKTTLTEHLAQRFGPDISVVHHDNYYKRQDCPFEERCKQNYDHPDAFDTELMVEDLKRLKAGEGILIFQNKALRDVEERGRSMQSVVEQYLATVKPMHEQFVEPSKRNASIIVPEGGCNRVAMQMLLSQVRSHLRGED